MEAVALKTNKQMVQFFLLLKYHIIKACMKEQKFPLPPQ